MGHDYRRGAIDFGDYAREWIENGGTRGKLAPRTRDLYLDILDRQLAYFAAMELRAIQPDTVRRWFKSTGDALAKSAATRSGSGKTRLRQSYALLRAILGTAVDDRRIAENPAKIRGAGVATSPERPHMGAEQFALIVGACPERMQSMLALAYGAHLRLGELVALERRDLDLDLGRLRVERQTVTVKRLNPAPGETKTMAVTTPTKTGNARTVVLPPTLICALRDYVETMPPGIGRAPLFTSPDGQPIAREQIQRAWRRAASSVGLDQFHVHDIRHAGLTAAAQAGATIRELMERAGHRSPTVALTYQHAAEERGRIIAAGIDVPLRAALPGANSTANGTQLAREATAGLGG